MAERDFDASSHSARAVRAFVQETLNGVSRLDDIVLIASEATNVIRHACTEFTVHLDREGNGVRVEVSDGSSIIPAIHELAESKQGLRIVGAISDRWGIDRTANGKKVWVVFSKI